MYMIILASVISLIAGFMIGCIYVLMTRWIKKKSFSRKNKGFSHSDSIHLQADRKVLHSGRVERSAVKYRLEDQNT